MVKPLLHKFFMITTLLIFTTLSVSADEDDFIAAGVQFEIIPENYISQEDFFEETEEIIEEICSEEEVDLIVFPEYIGVFYQLIGLNKFAAGYNNLEQALQAVKAELPGIKNLHDIFLNSAPLKEYMKRWSALAESYETAIVAGTIFAVDEDNELKNRMMVFNSDGDLIHQQDKVFLTDFEKEMIDLSPGRIEDANSFVVSGKEVAVTICRDTFFEVWEEKYDDVFLWVDIKANGADYNQEQEEIFLTALPERMINTDINYGMTVCAVGEYLDLFWEGESTALVKERGRLHLADESKSEDSGDVIFLITDN